MAGLVEQVQCATDQDDDSLWGPGQQLPIVPRCATLAYDTMAAQQKRQGEPMGVMDSLIAATALQHKMVLVTRNVADFRATSLSVLNPWD